MEADAGGGGRAGPAGRDRHGRHGAGDPQELCLERGLVELVGRAAHEHHLVLVEQGQVHMAEARHEGHHVQGALVQPLIGGAGPRGIDDPDPDEPRGGRRLKHGSASFFGCPPCP